MTIAAQALLLAATLFAQGEKPLLVFDGNVVLSEEVYKTVLDFPEEAKATKANARLVRARLTSFLQRSGYELAKVKTELVEGQIRVHIDEGRVDKVIVLGQGAYTTLRVKLDLSLPHDVFNRPMLDRQLKVLAEKYGLKNYRYELVAVEHGEHVGPQIENLGTIQDAPVIPPAAPLELHILLEGFEWRTGFSPDLVFGRLEGVGVGARLRTRNTFLERDRVDVRGRAAASLRRPIDGGGSRPVLSRAIVDFRYFTPPVFGRDVRPFLWLQSDLLNRQRPDLRLEGFWWLNLEASLALQFRFLDRISASAGAGIEHRRLFGTDVGEGVDPVVAETPGQETLPFVMADFELVFNPSEVRRDRRHVVTLETRFYARAGVDRDSSLRIFGAYQKVFILGYHEFWLRAAAASLHGDVPFPDEEPVGGQHLRGPFGNDYSARRVASAGVEFRLSLVRDIFKIGVFHDFATFLGIHLDFPRKNRMYANAFGLGAHWLFMDAFQLDAYYGLGFASGGEFDRGFTLAIRQAF